MTEKKNSRAGALLAKLALFLAPILLYFIIFIIFEPYNYFGLQNNATESDQVIYRVRQFVNDPQDAIILGDSRMAHMDMEQVEALTGRRFSNLAFGGAAENEMIDLCEFALERNPDIDTVYLEVSFYTLNSRYDKNRVSNIETIVTNPLAYLFNFDYNIEMLNRIRLHLQGAYLGVENETAVDPVTGELKYTEADYTDESGAPLPYRRQLLEYNEVIRPICTGYTVNEAALQRLVDLAALCKERGVELNFVLPPVADSVYNEIIVELGIEPQLAAAVETLRATGANVIDLEYSDRPALEEYMFFDGFHVDTTLALPLVTEMIFGE